VQQPVAPPLQNLTQSRPFTAQTGRTPPAPAPVVAPADTPFARGMNTAQAQLDQQTARPATTSAAPAAPARPAPVMASSRQEADLLRMQGIDARAEGDGAMWDTLKKGFFYNSDVAAQQAKTAAAATAAAGPAAVAQTSDSTRPAGSPAAPATQAVNNQPNPTPTQSPSQNPDAPKQDPMTGVQVGNTVQANRQPNGVMEFSGSNITSGFNYGGNAGFRPSGAGVTTMPAANFAQASPSAAAAVSDARRNAMQRGDLDQVASSMGMGGRQGPVNLTPQTAEGRMGFDQGEARRLLNQAMTKRPGESRADFATRSGAALRALGLETDERGNIRTNNTQQRGQDVNATTATADRTSRERIEGSRQALDAQRIAPEIEAAGFRNRQAATQEALFKQWTEAKTPEEKASALERLRVLQGGGGEQRPRFTVVPGGQELDVKTGATITRPSTVFDESTRQFIQNPYATTPGAASQVQTGPRVGAISEVEGEGFAVWNGTEWVRQ